MLEKQKCDEDGEEEGDREVLVERPDCRAADMKVTNTWRNKSSDFKLLREMLCGSNVSGQILIKKESAWTLERHSYAVMC